MSINPGDIIIIENMEPGRSYSGKVWSNQFLLVRHAWRVDDITNGGKITAHDFHGKRKMIHALDKPPCYPYIVRVVPARGI